MLLWLTCVSVSVLSLPASFFVSLLVVVCVLISVALLPVLLFDLICVYVPLVLATTTIDDHRNETSCFAM